MNILEWKHKLHGRPFREGGDGDGGGYASDMAGSQYAGIGYGPGAAGESSGAKTPTVAGVDGLDMNAPPIPTPYQGSLPSLFIGLTNTSLGAPDSETMSRVQDSIRNLNTLASLPSNFGDRSDGYDNRTTLEKLGVYPGMTNETYQTYETPAMRDQRIGMVGNTLGAIGQGVMTTFSPGWFNLARAGIGAYDSYQHNPDQSIPSLVGGVMQGLPGYFGAIASGLQGNYGQAVTQGLTKMGADPYSAMVAGLGTDATMGKDVTKPAAGLAGYFAGNRMSGPVGGVIGSNVASNLASIYGRNK
jgi:hypothetical protein